MFALLDHDLLDLGGTYGDPNAGDPIQHDELRIEHEQAVKCRTAVRSMGPVVATSLLLVLVGIVLGGVLGGLLLVLLVVVVEVARLPHRRSPFRYITSVSRFLMRNMNGQLSLMGDVSPSSGPTDTCAVLLTTAKLKQNSSSKDATPQDFKLHELRTTGTAKGTNEIITYVSLKSGLVVRATEDATQFMDVVVAQADGSNRVHFNVDAKSHAEVLLVTETPLNQP